MIKKILFSVASIAAVAGLAFGATQAFFSDTETSEGNTLVAGALDLKIDNTCYYNGQACTNGFFGGNVGIGHTNPPCDCTWKSKDLDEEVFFDLRDLKPGDWEEDTISIDVDNPSWLCADIIVRRDADNSCTEPELEDETNAGNVCVPPDSDGELAENLFFVFWSDDGDNVFEEDEVNNILTRGPADDVLGHVRWALADSQTGRGPIGAGKTYYIGKFFCFGDIGLNLVAQDGLGATDPVTNGPNTRGSGFTCDGKPVDNQPQTDSLEGDISFYAEQARHNDKFLCNPPLPTPTVTPTVTPTPILPPEPTIT